MAALNGSSGLSPSVKQTILGVLEEFTNALVVYQHTLEKPQRCSADISVDCILPDTTDLGAPNINLRDDITARIKNIKKEDDNAKLYEKSEYLRNILDQLKEEFHEKGTYEVLKKEVEKMATRGSEEEAMLEEIEKMEKLAADLRSAIADEKIANEGEKKRLLKKLAETRNKTNKLKLLEDAKLKYVTALEESRYERNLLRHDMQIERLEKEVNDRRMRQENENRVHSALMKFCEGESQMLEKNIKEWTERYKREKEMYEKEIRNLRDEVQIERKVLQELQEEFRRNQEFINNYLAAKEALRKQKEREENMRRSAIRIQAWWRGVMVRRKLGPYRPEEKKKKRAIKSK